MDRQNYDSQDRASIAASRGKKVIQQGTTLDRDVCRLTAKCNNLSKSIFEEFTR